MSLRGPATVPIAKMSSTERERKGQKKVRNKEELQVSFNNCPKTSPTIFCQPSCITGRRMDPETSLLLLELRRSLAKCDPSGVLQKGRASRSCPYSV